MSKMSLATRRQGGNAGRNVIRAGFHWTFERDDVSPRNVDVDEVCGRATPVNDWRETVRYSVERPGYQPRRIAPERLAKPIDGRTTQGHMKSVRRVKNPQEHFAGRLARPVKGGEIICERLLDRLVQVRPS